MTTGNIFIRSCCDAEAAGVFRQAPQDWFLETEESLYVFVKDHLSLYGVMPTTETIREEGFTLLPSSEPPSYYLDRLRMRAQYDSVNSRLQAMIEALGNRNMESVKGLLSEMNSSLHEATSRGTVSTMAEEAALVVDELSNASMNNGLLGISTGWPTLDRYTQGLVAGDVAVLVGRPSVGKSYIMMHMAHHAWLHRTNTLITSMEMSVQQLARRLVAMEAGVNPDPIRRGQISSWTRPTISDAATRFAIGPPMHFFSGNVRRTTDDLDSMIQQLSPDVAFVDAGYLLTPARNRRRSGRREYISDVMEEIKAISQERNIPIVVTVQFNREATKSKRGKLGLHMIAETDVISQIASIIVGVTYGEGIYERSQRSLSILKNRDGEVGDFNIKYEFSPPCFNEIVSNQALRQTRQIAENEDVFDEEGSITE